jgi:hypothetical protein
MLTFPDTIYKPSGTDNQDVVLKLNKSLYGQVTAAVFALRDLDGSMRLRCLFAVSTTHTL